MVNRVSTSGKYAQLVADMQRQMFNYNKITKQLASGSKITSIIEDPIAAVNILNTNRQLGQIDTFSQNVELAQTELNALDDLMELATGYLSTAWDKAIQANSQTYGKSSLEALKIEIDEITKTMVDLANTEYNDNYIFGGANTKITPYEIAENGDIIYRGTPHDNPDYIRFTEVADKVFEIINTTGDQVFGYYKTTYNYETQDGSSVYEENGKYYYDKYTGNTANLTQINQTWQGDELYYDRNGNVVLCNAGIYYVHDKYNGNSGDLALIGKDSDGNLQYQDQDGKLYSYVNENIVSVEPSRQYLGNSNELWAMPEYDKHTTNILYKDAYGNTIVSEPDGYRYKDKIEYIGEVKATETGEEYSGVMGALKKLSNSIQKVIDGIDVKDEDAMQVGYAEMNSTLDMFKNSLEAITSEQTKFGGVANRLEMTTSTLETNSDNLTTYLSNIQDIDLAAAITEWMQAQYAYQASMQVTSATMNMSLLNYL